VAADAPADATDAVDQLAGQGDTLKPADRAAVPQTQPPLPAPAPATVTPKVVILDQNGQPAPPQPGPQTPPQSGQSAATQSGDGSGGGFWAWVGGLFSSGH
jgi:hypothetical protein